MRIVFAVCLFLTQQMAAANLRPDFRKVLSQKGFPDRLHKDAVIFVKDPVSHTTLYYYSRIVIPLLKNYEQARGIIKQIHGASEARKFEETMQLLEGRINPVTALAKEFYPDKDFLKEKTGKIDGESIEIDGESITVTELLRRYKEVVAESNRTKALLGKLFDDLN